MNYTYNPEIWPALIALVAATGLTWYAWRRHNLLAAKAIALAGLFGVLWSLGAVLEISAADFSTRVFWFKFQTIWQSPSAAAILCFILAYAGLGRWLNRRNVVLISVIPLLSILVIITNNLHHLLWTGFLMNGQIIASAGSLYWVFNGYVYFTGLVNFAILVWLAINSPVHRWPVAIIISGQIIARVGYTLNKVDTSLIGLGESVLFTIGVVLIAYAVAFFWFYAIDPIAAARKAVLGQMQEGMLVLDLHGRIIDANPAAAAMIGISETNLRKKLLAKVMPVDTDSIDQMTNGGTSRSEIVLGKGNSARYYNLNMTPLRDRNGEFSGRLLLLHDITEPKRTQAQVLEQRQVMATLEERERLAREFHDGIGQTLGYAAMQAQIVRKLVKDGSLERAGSVLDRLVEVTQDAHGDIRESILNLKAGSSQEWFFFPTLKQYLNRYQEFYGIRTELSIADALGEDILDPIAEAQLLRVIQEALTNARKHSSADSVRIAFQHVDNQAQITIADNGRGFDPGQLKPEEGGHFGLGFMRERMEQIGGSLIIDARPGAGTVVKLEVPLRNQREEKI